MKNYERPIVLITEELAEGVYAASGAGIGTEENPICWTVSTEKSQADKNGGWARFRIIADHPATVTHISSKSTVVITFNNVVTAAKFESFSATVDSANGTIVVLERESHGNSYYSADNYNTELQVWTSDPDALEVVTATITCTPQVNVQGGYDWSQQ